MITGTVLDSGSNRSYCTEHLVNQLQAVGKPVSLSIDMFMRETSMLKAQEINLVAVNVGMRKRRTVEIPRTLVVKHLPASLETAAPSNEEVIKLWSRKWNIVDGHYQLPIPFWHAHLKLPDNKRMAEQRLQSLKGRLQRHPQLGERYKEENEYVCFQRLPLENESVCFQRLPLENESVCLQRLPQENESECLQRLLPENEFVCLQREATTME